VVLSAEGSEKYKYVMPGFLWNKLYIYSDSWDETLVRLSALHVYTINDNSCWSIEGEKFIGTLEEGAYIFTFTVTLTKDKRFKTFKMENGSDIIEQLSYSYSASPVCPPELKDGDFKQLDVEYIEFTDDAGVPIENPFNIFRSSDGIIAPSQQGIIIWSSSRGRYIHIFADSPIKSVYITDFTGHSKSLSDINSDELDIQLKFIHWGIYLVRVETAEKIETALIPIF
jgi:hypothetical protein